MTISESIIKFLEAFEGGIKRVDTDSLRSEPVSYGLMKEPSQNVKAYLSGKKTYTDYYQFAARFNSKTDTDRIKNQAFMEELAKWIEEQNVQGNYPVLKGYKCSYVGVSTTFYMGKADENTAIYTLTIQIKYETENSTL